MTSQDPPSRAPGLEAKDIVSLYLAQTTTQNQLWATFLVGLFAAGAFAVAQRDPFLLVMGGVAFVIFALGHAYLVHGSLRLKQAAAEEIRLLLGLELPGNAHSKTLQRIARPSIEGGLFMVLHAAIDLSMIAVFIILWWRSTSQLP